MIIDLAGKTALVTGGASGIGFAIASQLASAGACVAINDIDPAAASDAAARIGRGAFPAAADVSDPAAVDRMIDAVLSRSPIDILVNNAGISQSLVSISRLAVEEWQRVMDVNLRGTYLVSRAVCQDMRARRTGAIVNVSSITGLTGFAASHAYGVSKAAVLMLTQTLACEVARHGIRVNAVAPGVIAAPMLDRMTGEGTHLAQVLARVPLGRLGEPREIANSVAFLCSDLATYITGTVLPVDGGWLAFGGAGNASTPG